MRLVFLFTQQGAAGADAVYDQTVKSINHFAVGTGGLKSEGYMWLLHRMVETKVVDEVVIFIESNRYPGVASIFGIPIHVVPHINNINAFLKPDDVIWVRGGFRSWHEWLVPKKGKHWLLLYGANTGRERWLFWDIIFRDTSDINSIDKRGRLHVEFHKPINPNIFYPNKSSIEYDVCIGASHVHDKKGQWKTIKAIIAYERLYSTKLKCVLPGRIMKGVHTNAIRKDITDFNLNVTFTGMVDRHKMNEIYNQSGLFVYLGGGGQNDRGPLEALSCGTPIIICNPSRHHSVVCTYDQVSCVSKDSMDWDTVAHEIGLMFEKREEDTKAQTHAYFEKENGIENVCLPEMKLIFDVIRANKKPTLKAQEEILRCMEHKSNGVKV